VQFYFKNGESRFLRQSKKTFTKACTVITVVHKKTYISNNKKKKHG